MGLFRPNTKTSISEKPRDPSDQDKAYTCIVNMNKCKHLFVLYINYLILAFNDTMS